MLLNERTLGKEIRGYLMEAAAIPDDDTVYARGDLKMRHRPQTKVRGRCVLVEKYGVLWRSRYTNNRWQATEQVSGRIDE